MQGIIPNPGISHNSNVNRGRMVNIPSSRYYHIALAKKMRDQSIWSHGGKLFNSLPVDIRNCTDSLETFKYNLDEFLMRIPDQPASSGLTPAPMTYDAKHSNSIIDWVSHLKLSQRRMETENDTGMGDTNDFVSTPILMDRQYPIV